MSHKNCHFNPIREISDPSLINNPNTALLKEFVNAIFYIGKGKRNRPMQHLIEAVKATENSYKVYS